MTDFEPTKDPNVKVEYTEEDLIDLIQSSKSPRYFIEKFVKVQHPTKGMLPLKLFEYQYEMLDAYHNHRKVLALCGRQLGKSLHSSTIIKHNDQDVQLKSLIPLSLRERLVSFLEDLAISLSKRIT